MKICNFATATWKDLRLIATTGKNAKAIVLYFILSICIPQLYMFNRTEFIRLKI